jgi:hypothetical protein
VLPTALCSDSRGHGDGQGNRTIGISEKVPADFPAPLKKRVEMQD